MIRASGSVKLRWAAGSGVAVSAARAAWAATVSSSALRRRALCAAFSAALRKPSFLNFVDQRAIADIQSLCCFAPVPSCPRKPFLYIFRNGFAPLHNSFFDRRLPVGISVGALLAAVVLAADSQVAYNSLLLGNAASYVGAGMLLSRVRVPPRVTSEAAPVQEEGERCRRNR